MSKSWQAIEKLMHETYLIIDKGILKLLAATVIGNRLPFDPIWLFLVGPSGAGKTEFINCLSGIIESYHISSITSKTFISGMKKRGVETSLLLQIKNGLLLFKDFTTVMNLGMDERQEIFAQLREIFDGSLVKKFGTGESVHWQGKIGLIAGITTVIHTQREIFAKMGERFIMYSFEIPDRMKLAEKAMENMDYIISKRAEIREAWSEFIDKEIGYPIIYPKLPAEMIKEIQLLTEFATRARSVVDRDWHTQGKEIVFVHDPEVPTRFAGQLKCLSIALMIVNQKNLLTEEDKNIIYKCALDSITSYKRATLQVLAQYKECDTKGVAIKMNYPTPTVKRWLEELNALKLINRLKHGVADSWQIKDEYRLILERFDRIKVKDEGLYAKTAEAEEEELIDEEWDSLSASSQESFQNGNLPGAL